MERGHLAFKKNMIHISKLYRLALLCLCLLFCTSAARAFIPMVDFELPSANMWCIYNLGADSPEEFGEYYLFDPVFDPAKIELRQSYTTPSRKEFEELILFTTQKWVTINGVKGIEFRGFNDATIFLPAAASLTYSEEDSEEEWEINNAGEGAYWSSTESNEEDYNYFLEFSPGEGDEVYWGNRDITANKLSIRPVFHRTTHVDYIVFEYEGLWYHIIGSDVVEVIPQPDGNKYHFENVVIPATAIYGSKEYRVIAIANEAFYGCSLISITLPKGLLSIGNESFGLCSMLESVQFPVSLVTIAPEAFDGCSSLTSIEFPKNSALKKLSWKAFANCSSLVSVTLPASLRYLGEGAFEDCPLETVVCHALTPPANYLAFDEEVFPTAVLYVPEEAIADYRTTYPWSKFSRIEPIENGSVSEIIPDGNNRYVVYNLQGVLILDTANRDDLTKLNEGIYIINGKKVMINN